MGLGAGGGGGGGRAWGEGGRGACTINHRFFLDFCFAENPKRNRASHISTVCVCVCVCVCA